MSNWIEIYTDGSCLGNPGPGGWACLLRKGHVEKLLSGSSHKDTTNNRMELTAVIEGLSALTKGGLMVAVYTDSQYIVNIMTNHSKPKANLDLWRKVFKLAEKQERVMWNWVRGHSTHPENQRVDEAARRQAEEVRKSLQDG